MNPRQALDELMVNAARLNRERSKVRGFGQVAGVVRIEVDLAGEITAMTVEQRAYGLPPEQLAAAVAQAHRTAMRQGREQGAELELDFERDGYAAMLVDAVMRVRQQ